MINTKKFAVLFQVAMTAGALSGFAGDGGVPAPTPNDQRPISWEEFKDRCADPDKYKGDIQRQPEHIVVQCQGTELSYVAEKPGTLPLPASQTITPTVISDKFIVTNQSQNSVGEAKGGSCLRYKEVRKTMNLENALSCGDILAIKGSLYDYCTSVVGTAKGTNPKVVKIEDTGVVIDTCAGAAAKAN